MSRYVTRHCLFNPLLPVGLALVLLLAGPTGCGSRTNAEAQIAAAKELIARHDARGAVVTLKSILQGNPNHAEARKTLGLLYADLGDGPSALKELGRAVELGVPHADVLIGLTRAQLLAGKSDQVLKDIDAEAAGTTPKPNLPPAELAYLTALRGDAYFSTQRDDEADRLYDAALALDAKSASGAVGKAAVLLRQQKRAEARTWLARATEWQPGFGPAWSLMGDIERADGKLAEAVTAYTRAIEAGLADNADTIKRGLVRVAQGDLDKASEDAKAVRQRAKKDPGATYLLAVIAYEKHNYAQAETHLHELLQVVPDDLAGLLLLGNTQKAQGAYEQADAALRRAVAVAPGLAMPRKVLAQFLLDRRQYTDVLELLEPVVQARPDDAAALGLMGPALLATGNRDRGLEYIRRSAELTPDSTAASTSYGFALLAQGDVEKGLSTLEQTTAMKNAGELTSATLAIAYLQAKQYDKAIVAAQHLMTAEPKNPVPLNLLAVAYRAKGQIDDARKAYEQVVALAPADPSAQHGLAELALAAGDRSAARSHYEAVLKEHPGHERTIVALAEMDLVDQHADAAIARLEAGLKADDKADTVRAALMRVLLDQGQIDKAESLLSGLTEKQASLPLMQQYRGEIALARGKAADAVQLFEDAARANPTANTYNWLSRAEAAAGNDAESRMALDQALKADPNHLPSLIARARTFEVDGDHERAASLMAAIVKAFPDNAEVLAQAGWLALQQKRPADAVAPLQAAMARAPSPQVVRALADAYGATGQGEQAFAVLRQWIESNPRDSVMRQYLALALASAGRSADAVAQYEAILGYQPGSSTAHYNIALLLKPDQPDAALKHARKAQEIDANAPAIQALVGSLMTQLGQTGEALNLLRAAALRAPQSDDIKLALAETLVATGDKVEARRVLDQLTDRDSKDAQALRARL